MDRSKQLEQVWLERIADSIAGIKYGQVHITIHDGRIVQIDRLERHRYELQSRDTVQRRSKLLPDEV